MPTILWPTITIPANTVEPILAVFGYGLFLIWPATQPDADHTLATPGQLASWYATLPLATSYAGKPAVTTIAHTDTVVPPPNPGTGNPLIDAVVAAIQPLIDLANSVLAAVKTASDAIAQTVTNGQKFAAWIKDPYTDERIVVMIVGIAVSLMGVSATVASFVDLPKAAASVAKILT